MESPTTPSPALERTQRLLALYLDTNASWNGELDAEMRRLCREDDEARAAYDRAVVAHRLAVGADTEEASGFERTRMREILLDQAVGAEATESVFSRVVDQITGWMNPPVLGAVAAAALLVLMVQPFGQDPATHPEDLRARGGQDATVQAVGIGIAGVTEGGQEYEALASGKLGLADHLRLSTTNEDPRLKHLFVLSLQAGSGPLWIAPLPPEETESLPLQRGRAVGLDFEVRVDARHRAGDVRFVALFTEKTVSVSRVQRAIEAGLFSMKEEALTAELRRRLGLGEVDRIQVVGTVIGEARDEATP